MQAQTGKREVSTAQIVSLILALVLVLIAFFIPMDIFGMYHMFSVHMVQHLLLSLAAPPLILLGVAPESLARFFGRHRMLARCARFLSIPFVASALFNANIWIWHAPVLMQVMMSNALIHYLVNILYLLTGLIFWAPLVGLLPADMHPLTIGKKLVYLFFSDMPMMLIGAGMTFSAPLYSFTMTNPSMYMVVTAEDQQLAGLLMWVVGGVFLLVLVSSILFLRWMLQQEKKQQEEDLELAQEEEMENEYTSTM